MYYIELQKKKTMKTYTVELLDPPCTSNNENSGFTKLGSYVDGIKPLLGPTLEHRIHSVLQEFVCNPKSRYVGRFPRVKKFLNVVAAWTDCFDSSARDTDIRKEVIKHTIEYLVKDGLVTQFVDPVVLNKVDRDSLAAEQNALKSMNVWRFINEKDYWLCQDCATTTVVEPGTDPQILQCNKENCNSDLDVEVGSLSKAPSTIYCSCRTTPSCSPLCDEKDGNANPSEVKVDYPNCIIFEPNQYISNCPQENPGTADNANYFPRKQKLQHLRNLQKSDVGRNCDCNKKIENKRSLQAQTSLSLSNFDFNQSTTNTSKQIPHNLAVSEHAPIKENIKTQDTATTCSCNQNTFPKNSKIKLYVRKTNAGCNKDRNLSKVSSLSLPCKSSQLIVRLFEADPTLSDSCLILMKKKFENDVRNACSCINDILRKLEARVIKQLCLICLIRPGHVDLNLRRKDRGISNVRQFLARVPICSNVHKRDWCHGSRESNENPKDRCGEHQSSKDLPVDPCCCRDVTRREEKFEERDVAFFSICSNLSLQGEKQVCSSRGEIANGERNGGITLVWARKREKQSSFVSPFGLMLNSERNEDCVPSGEERVSMILNQGRIEEEHLEAVEECCKPEEIAKGSEEKGICENFEQKTIESRDFNCSCCDSLKEGVFREEYSTTGGCNPEQCLCHVFCTENVIDKEHSRLETGNLEGGDSTIGCFCDSEDDASKVDESILEIKEGVSDPKISVLERNVSGSKVEKMHMIKEESISESKVKDLLIESTPKSEANISDAKETEESALEIEEKYSVDSICTPSRCSCCGDDLSNSSINEDTNLGSKDIIECIDRQERTSSTKISEKSNLITAEGVAVPSDAKNSSTRSCSKIKVNSKVINEPNVARSTHDRPPKTFENNLTDFPEKYPETSNEPKSDHKFVLINNHSEASKFSNERNLSPPESLFVFCRKTDSKLSSSGSNFFTDVESVSNDHSPTRNQMRYAKSHHYAKLKSSCVRPVVKSPHRKSSHFVKCHPSCSTKNLHSSYSAKPKIQRKVEKEDCDYVPPRYKNRLWRGSIIPGSLCSSFPAIDRIKYLIRKKLRKLLLEERDKGTSTSKTFLRNDRYLVSISSGKLNNGRRIVRESCSIRCPFTTRNRYDAGGAPEKTFTEGSFPRRKKDVFGDQKMISGHDVCKRTNLSKISPSLGQKYSSKSTDTKDLFCEKREILVKSKLKAKNEEKFTINPPVNGTNCRKRSSIASLNSMGMILLEEDDDFLKQKLFQNKQSYNANGNGKTDKNYYLDSNLPRCCSGKNNCWCSNSDSSPEGKRSAWRTVMEERTRRDKLKRFEKRLFKIEGNRVEDYNFESFLSDYEKHINDLDADFRLKLLQYVALCRSVKNSLIKRLQSDDVYEVSSSSV